MVTLGIVLIVLAALLLVTTLVVGFFFVRPIFRQQQKIASQVFEHITRFTTTEDPTEETARKMNDAIRRHNARKMWDWGKW